MFSGLSHIALGKKGEKVAIKFLKAKGFDILFKNFISDNRTGEIDIVARDGGTLCFVEVKTRHSSFHIDNSSEETWLRKHQADRIINAANDYLKKIGNPSVRYRFDLIEIEFGHIRLKSISHWEKGFGMNES